MSSATEPLFPWELILQIMAMFQSVMAETEPALTALGLETKQFFLLSVLDENPNPAQLAKTLMLPRPSITFLIKQAEAAGHIRREAVPEDLRKFRLSLTPSGREVMEKGREILNTRFGERLSRLSHAELQAFLKIIDVLR